MNESVGIDIAAVRRLVAVQARPGLLRIWQAYRRSIATQRLARAEARDLRRSLSCLGLPQSDVSRAIPGLARNIAEYDQLRARKFLILGIPFLVLLLLLPQLMEGFGHNVLFPASLFLPKLEPDAETLADGLYLIAFFILTWLAAELQIRSTDWRRLMKYGLVGVKLLDRLYRFTRWYVPFLLLFFTMFIVYLTSKTWTDGHTIWFATATAGTAVLWFTTIGFGVLWAGSSLFALGSPDVELVRVLADAYTAVIAGGPSDFRSFARRAEICAYLRRAAHLLDGPMLRKLARGDRAAEAVVRPPLEAAAAGLRQKLPWLATPKNDTREHLARWLGEALIAATTGDLARLTDAEPTVTAAAVTWQGRLVGFARWAFIALGPAAVLWLGWSLIPDAATRGLAAQFAALCFVVATFSALDPSGRDKLSSVASAGTALFGWGKSKG